MSMSIKANRLEKRRKVGGLGDERIFRVATVPTYYEAKGAESSIEDLDLVWRMGQSGRVRFVGGIGIVTVGTALFMKS